MRSSSLSKPDRHPQRLEQKLVERWPSWFNVNSDPLETPMTDGFAHGVVYQTKFMIFGILNKLFIIVLDTIQIRAYKQHTSATLALNLSPSRCGIDKENTYEKMVAIHHGSSCLRRANGIAALTTSSSGVVSIFASDVQCRPSN
jgi:hypothetical protein